MEVTASFDYRPLISFYVCIAAQGLAFVGMGLFFSTLTRNQIVAAEQSTDRIGAIAAYATWSDCGLAAGAFIGIMGMEWLGYPVTYAALAAATLAAVVWFTLARATPPQGHG
jgi:predicted MFS family arabinose efflux permease